MMPSLVPSLWMRLRGHAVRSFLISLLIAILSVARGEQIATLVNPGPIDFIKGTSHITRPVNPDEVFRVISASGDNVTLTDFMGFQTTLRRSDLKIADSTAPAAALSPAKATESTTTVSVAKPDSTPRSTLTITTPQVPAETPLEQMSAADADTMKKLNAAFQMPLFADASLWNDDVAKVAARVNWPQESQTDMDSSYRRYALDSGTPVLGAQAYSLALYGIKGHPSYVSIVFANKGDFKGSSDALSAAVEKDVSSITATLTAVLGPPETHIFGVTSDSEVTVHRWNWNDQAILLSSPLDEYAAIKVIPTEVADNFGNVDNMDRDTLRDELATRVLKRDNGDVVIQQIPMVDQGPKGYCVPATWERYLRYVDVPADMYVLAMLGNSGAGGGTSIEALRYGVNDYVEAYHRRIEETDGELNDINDVSKFIDKGLPLMWACNVVKQVEDVMEQRTIARQKVTDWAAYAQGLDATDNALFSSNQQVLGGHMRMIIGYNAQTNELAISDSWGPHFKERWITLKEAQQTSQKSLEYIQW